MNRALRIKILTKLAQTTPTTPTEAVDTKSVSGSPEVFIASQRYPSLRTGWNGGGVDNTTPIDTLTAALNQAIYYSSNGQLEIAKDLFNTNNFTAVASKYGDPTKKLVLFYKILFEQIFNSKNEFKAPLSSEERKMRVGLVKNDTNLTSLPIVAPTGQLATKLPTNLKTLIIAELDKIH
jgi:hypothetical protein